MSNYSTLRSGKIFPVEPLPQKVPTPDLFHIPLTYAAAAVAAAQGVGSTLGRPSPAPAPALAEETGVQAVSGSGSATTSSSKVPNSTSNLTLQHYPTFNPYPKPYNTHEITNQDHTYTNTPISTVTPDFNPQTPHHL